jgi:hypothetical protein
MLFIVCLADKDDGIQGHLVAIRVSGFLSVPYRYSKLSLSEWLGISLTWVKPEKKNAKKVNTDRRDKKSGTH